MRGSDWRSAEVFSYVDIEARIRANHPLRTIKAIVDEAPEAMSADFDALDVARQGRPSTPSEMLLRAMLLQAFYSIRCERQLMERLEFDLLFRWFVGPSANEAAWDHATFSKNRDRLLKGEIAARFQATVLAQPRVTRHAGYRASQRLRKRIEEGFGWIKTVGGMRKSRFIGRAKTDFAFTFAMAAYNLVRSPKLQEAAA